MSSSIRTPSRRRTAGAATFALALSSGLLVTGLPGPAQAMAVPQPTVALPAGVEAFEPYVGQAGCDPVAKPGVLAFQRMLMNTYRDTNTLGIVRDCGIGGQSEHKEGRAFDWAVSVNNPNQVAEVQTVFDWLLASQGNESAVNARRLGIMYMIWNHRIWKAYDPSAGWQPYTGPVPHTDHVHFSFGWNAAYAHTSWWSGSVAPVEYGPYLAARPPSVTPVAMPGNLWVVATYGSTTLAQGSTGDAVKLVQSALKIDADGDYGPITAGRVRDFQVSQGLTANGVFGPAEWPQLFPRPTSPFGGVDAATMTSVRGWALDPDTTAPISLQVTVDGRPWGSPGVAGAPRPDLGPIYPGVGTDHGYTLPVDVPAGTHAVCVVGLNVGPGANAVAGCGSATVATAATRDGHFLNALYTDLLGRPSDPGGLDWWYARLQAGTSRSDAAVTMLRSDEYLTRLATGLYTGILGRDPDPAGLAAWRSALLAGVTPAAALTTFYACDEYYARAGGTDTAWVDGLYRTMLGREPDPDGQRYWAQTAADRGRGYVAAAFYGGTESVQRRVQAQYRAYLGRAADPAGLAFSSQLLAGQGDRALTSWLVASAEYDTIALARY